eukprot:230904-Rhodomonas_salina.2
MLWFVFDVFGRCCVGDCGVGHGHNAQPFALFGALGVVPAVLESAASWRDHAERARCFGPALTSGMGVCVDQRSGSRRTRR